MHTDEISHVPRGLNILLADDDKDDCLLFKEVLDELRLNTRFTAVHNGEELMQLLTGNKSELFDVLFLDLNMPRKSGYACLEEIKRNKNIKPIPVIIFSTLYDEVKADLLYNNGAQHYICKPADFYDMKKVIEKALKIVLENNGDPGRTSQPPRENFFLNYVKTILL